MCRNCFSYDLNLKPDGWRRSAKLQLPSNFAHSCLLIHIAEHLRTNCRVSKKAVPLGHDN